MRTTLILGSYGIEHAGGRNLFGPTIWLGEARSEKTGSMMKLSGPICMTAVECPIQVYLMSCSLTTLKSGFIMGSSLSSSSLSFFVGSLLMWGFSLANFLIYGKKVVMFVIIPFVIIVFLSSSNLRSNSSLNIPVLTFTEGLRNL
jgi:hypothetical protein